MPRETAAGAPPKPKGAAATGRRVWKAAATWRLVWKAAAHALLLCFTALLALKLDGLFSRS